MASLMVVSGRSRGCYLLLDEDTTTIGRDESCDAQVLDEMVSRRHLEIRYWAPGDRFQIVDLDSANGVYVNDRRVHRPTLLRHGDVVTIGESRIVYSDGEIADCAAADRMFRMRGQAVRSTIVPGAPWPFRLPRPVRSRWSAVPA